METTHMKHDEGCPGCVYERRRQLNGIGVRITDYKTQCSKCEGEITGEFEHRIKRRTYCQRCTPVDILTVPCGKCGIAIDWDVRDSNTSTAGNGYSVACECGHVQDYSPGEIRHTHIGVATH
jgi:hypothetical protein